MNKPLTLKSPEAGSPHQIPAPNYKGQNEGAFTHPAINFTTTSGGFITD